MCKPSRARRHQQLTPTAANHMAPSFFSFLSTAIRDVLLAAVLFQACTTSFSIYLTAPVQSAVLGISLFGLVTLLSLHSRLVSMRRVEMTSRAPGICGLLVTRQ